MPEGVLLGELPGVNWVGEGAGIQILADDMVTFGGSENATDLDVLNGDAPAEGVSIVRGGSAQATGAVTITVAGGATPMFS